MNELARFPAPRSSFLSRCHPGCKFILALLLLLAYLFIPDRSAPVVAVKLVLIILLAFFSGGFSRWRNWLRVLLFLASFLILIYSVTYLGGILSGAGNLIRLHRLALKSFWMVNISFLFTISFCYRELIYLARVWRVPPFLSSQVLIIFLVWSKLAAEFSRVPLAWKCRGAGGVRAGLLINMLKVVLLRTLRRASCLERSFLSRGFEGEFYTFWSWRGKNATK